MNAMFIDGEYAVGDPPDEFLNFAVHRDDAVHRWCRSEHYEENLLRMMLARRRNGLEMI